MADRPGLLGTKKLRELSEYYRGDDNKSVAIRLLAGGLLGEQSRCDTAETKLAEAEAKLSATEWPEKDLLARAEKAEARVAELEREVAAKKSDLSKALFRVCEFKTSNNTLKERAEKAEAELKELRALEHVVEDFCTCPGPCRAVAAVATWRRENS